MLAMHGALPGYKGNIKMPYTIKQLLNLPGTGHSAPGHCSLPVSGGYSGGATITRARSVPTLPPLPSQLTMVGGNVKAYTKAKTYIVNSGTVFMPFTYGT